MTDEGQYNTVRDEYERRCRQNNINPTDGSGMIFALALLFVLGILAAMFLTH